MAQMILTLVVGAGILPRFLTSYLATMIRKKDGYIHVIAQSEDEAEAVVKRIFDDQANAISHGDEQTRCLVEINGRIYASRMLVGKRSPWPRRLLGVLASALVFSLNERVNDGPGTIQENLPLARA